MNHKTLLTAFLAAATLAIGCNEKDSTTQQLNKVQTETKQDAQAMKTYTFAQKDEFVKAMQTRLTALDKDLDALSAKIEQSSDSVKADAKPKLQAMRDQAAKLQGQLAGASNATESTWDSVKADSEKAWDSLQNDFTSARQWLSDKIAP